MTMEMLVFTKVAVTFITDKANAREADPRTVSADEDIFRVHISRCGPMLSPACLVDYVSPKAPVNNYADQFW